MYGYIDPSQFNNWQDSLAENGTVCCKAVPPAAIKQHRVLKWDVHLWAWMGGDAVPGLENYQLCSHEYREMIEAFMDKGEAAVRTLIEERGDELVAAAKEVSDVDDFS